MIVNKGTLWPIKTPGWTSSLQLIVLRKTKSNVSET